MALKKEIKNNKGEKTEYHRISHLEIDFDLGQIHIYIKSYTEEQYRNLEKSQIKEIEKNINNFNEKLNLLEEGDFAAKNKILEDLNQELVNYTNQFNVKQNERIKEFNDTMSENIKRCEELKSKMDGLNSESEEYKILKEELDSIVDPTFELENIENDEDYKNLTKKISETVDELNKLIDLHNELNQVDIAELSAYKIETAHSESKKYTIPLTDDWREDIYSRMIKEIPDFKNSENI